jgi:hypothetical protein
VKSLIFSTQTWWLSGRSDSRSPGTIARVFRVLKKYVSRASASSQEKQQTLFNIKSARRYEGERMEGFYCIFDPEI